MKWMRLRKALCSLAVRHLQDGSVLFLSDSCGRDPEFSWYILACFPHVRFLKRLYDTLFGALIVSLFAMKKFQIYNADCKCLEFKDDDQNKYGPPTPLQSVVSTVRYSWNALSLSPLVSRLGTIGAAVAGRLATAVNGLRPQAADEISAPVPKALKICLDDFDDWEPEENIDDEGRVHSWQSNEGAKSDMKYSRNENNNGPYTDTEHRACNCYDRSAQEHNVKLRAQEEGGPRFQQEEQFYDPLGVSTMWQRAVKQEESRKRKQLLQAQWQEKEEKGAYQKNLNTWADAGMPSSAGPKSTHTTRKNEETNQQMRTPICAHTGVHGKVRSRNSIAGMQRDAHVTISLPRSKQVTVQRSSTKRRAGRSVR